MKGWNEDEFIFIDQLEAKRKFHFISQKILNLNNSNAEHELTNTIVYF